MLGLVHSKRLETGEIYMSFVSKPHYQACLSVQEKLEQLVGPVKIEYLDTLATGIELGGEIGGEVVSDVPQRGEDQEAVIKDSNGS
jgi:hypothetical protein